MSSADKAKMYILDFVVHVTIMFRIVNELYICRRRSTLINTKKMSWQNIMRKKCYFRVYESDFKYTKVFVGVLIVWE